MILASHIIVGVAVAEAFPAHPVLAFSAAFASHYIMDAVPHWEYNLISSKTDLDNPLNNDIIIGKDFISDLKSIFFDMFLGIIISSLLFDFFFPRGSIGILLVGIAGGVTPDILQFAYFRLRCEPFKSLYLFHCFVHTHTEKLKKHFIVGIFLQILFVTSVVLLIKFL